MAVDSTSSTTSTTSSAGTISSAGIGSGLDVNSIITQLMAIEQRPITALQTKATAIQTQISEFGKEKSAMSDLRDAARKLTNLDSWTQTAASSSGTAVEASAGSGATPASYSISVQSLAQTQSLASGAFAATSAIGAGTMHIDFGAWNAGQTAFTPKTGATSLDIGIAATDKLSDVRDKINRASGSTGVTASIFTDSTGSRLLLNSGSTGVSNAFRVSVTDADGGNTDATGLSALAYDPASGVNSMTRTQTASNATATFNGLAVNSESNTLTNVVDGLTLKLNAITTTSGPVNVAVAQDNTALKKMVQTFADSYNALYSLIGTQTKYDATSKIGGPLQGDSSATNLRMQLRSLANARSGASTAFKSLSDVGLVLDANGAMSVNATKLDSALANPTEMRKFMLNIDSTTPGNNGLGTMFRKLGDSMLGIDGALTARTDGLSRKLDGNQAQQDRLALRNAATEKRLRAQYTALDTTVAQYSSLGSYVSQQVAQYNKSSA